MKIKSKVSRLLTGAVSGAMLLSRKKDVLF